MIRISINNHPCVPPLLAFLLIMAFAATSYAVAPASFTALNPLGGNPIGWTFAGNKFVGTIEGDGAGYLYSTNLSGGNIQPFAAGVNIGTGHVLEHYISASLGLGGFPVGDLYVTDGQNVRHITNSGADAGLVIGSTTPITGIVRGIAFDPYGNFGNKMVITTDQGYVYTVSSTGIANQIAWTQEDTEGLDFSNPNGTWSNFGGNNLNGWLFVASEISGSVRAIKATNSPTSAGITVASGYSGAEQLTFVPLALTGNPLEGLYTARYAADVSEIQALNFSGMEGDIIFTSETGKQIYDFSPTLGIANIGAHSPLQPEDGVFVTADMLGDLGVSVPEPASLSLLCAGALLFLRRRRV